MGCVLVAIGVLIIGFGKQADKGNCCALSNVYMRGGCTVLDRGSTGVGTWCERFCNCTYAPDSDLRNEAEIVEARQWLHLLGQPVCCTCGTKKCHCYRCSIN
jgi:hypothetical protein